MLCRVQHGGITHGPLQCLMENQGTSVSGTLQTTMLRCRAQGQAHNTCTDSFGCSVYLKVLPTLAAACMRWLLC